MTKKIAVLGAGANGASIGADVTRAGHDVVLIDQWPEHVAAMRQRGARIEMPGEVLEQEVRAYNLCDVCTFTEKFDIVLLVMKAYDSKWATQLIEPYLKADGLVAGVQNGMTVDTIASVVGPERTMGCVIEISSMMYDPGVVQRHSNHARSWFAVGSIDPATAGREEEIAALLRCAGKVEIVDDIRATKWMKLVSNATTLVSTGILGLSMHDAVAIPEMRELMLRSGEEALQTGIGLGHPVLPIFGMTADDVRKSNRLVETLLDTLLAGFTLSTTKTTVLQDWQKGRHSEVDDLNGLVAAEAGRLGRSAPVNAAIVELAHRIEKGALKPDPSNLPLLLELAAGKAA
ncbi:MAG: 2-dehydropantoate 2-reductase [Rhizobiaceae bacterium]|nr:2-dehydropantoate 2-reductase [Rhizobiaceae bacterium]